MAEPYTREDAGAGIFSCAGVAICHALEEQEGVCGLCCVALPQHAGQQREKHAAAMRTVGIDSLLLDVGGIDIIPEVPPAATSLCRESLNHLCVEPHLARLVLRGAASRGCREDGASPSVG